MARVEEVKLLSVLQRRAEENDYYGLLGVESEASVDELAKARRDKSRELHPDHYANDDKLKEKYVRGYNVMNLRCNRNHVAQSH